MPRRDVADRRIAEERRRHQHPEQSAEQRDALRDRSGALALTTPPAGRGDEAPAHDEEQERRVDPGRRAAKAVAELVSEDFAKSHDATSPPRCALPAPAAPARR